MIPLLVPDIEGGSPERDGEEEEEGGAEEGLVLQYSSRLIYTKGREMYIVHCTRHKQQAPERDAQDIQLRLEGVMCRFSSHAKCVHSGKVKYTCMLCISKEGRAS